ncbi:hypothetical protein [Streptomyces curacoi]|uniref:hypothetical protein n=1 Tax=Streptomyces curacoi TaxID=146536 RepID=UPI000A8A022C|nr:hypothetical protein [Streptomyces curacoi]
MEPEEDDRGHQSPDTEPRSGRRRGLLVPALVNLALGVPAIIPLYLTYWLLTEYLPMDCRDIRDMARPDVQNCNFHTLDHAGPVMFALALTGALLLMLVVMVDVLRPRTRPDDGPGRWLATAALIPVPFATLLYLAQA